MYVICTEKAKGKCFQESNCPHSVPHNREILTDSQKCLNPCFKCSCEPIDIVYRRGTEVKILSKSFGLDIFEAAQKWQGRYLTPFPYRGWTVNILESGTSQYGGCIVAVEYIRNIGHGTYFHTPDFYATEDLMILENPIVAVENEIDKIFDLENL